MRQLELNSLPLLEFWCVILKIFFEVTAFINLGVVKVYNNGFANALIGTTNIINHTYVLPTIHSIIVV